jgi:hypothetical protein
MTSNRNPLGHRVYRGGAATSSVSAPRTNVSS